ncbi:MAG: hypothetical protein O2887_16210 [Bacteroidetes bacterium]|nr:hypothetical protein [Bacteroidota bacterium]MDA1122007.1 hypothetical protein [Bacteroidota bacterium]
MTDPKETDQNEPIREYFNFREVFTYFFRKQDPTNKPSINLRIMHGINKFSIIVFLIALIIWLIKRLV